MHRPLQFLKSSQHFFRANSERLSVAAMRVRNPDRPPFAIQSLHAAQTPPGFAEVVGLISQYFTRSAAASLSAQNNLRYGLKLSCS
jgi:hypothetical protein